jgi:sec-independent protein translocase protein TatB
MFGIGGTELLVIFMVALVVLGPERLPNMMKILGKIVGNLRRASTEFQRSINNDSLQVQSDEGSVPMMAHAVTSSPKGVPASEPDARSIAVDSGIRRCSDKGQRMIPFPRKRRIMASGQEPPIASAPALAPSPDVQSPRQYTTPSPDKANRKSPGSWSCRRHPTKAEDKE